MAISKCGLLGRDFDFTQPMEPMNPRDPGHEGRLKIYAALADLPMPGIASSARAISGLPDK